MERQATWQQQTDAFLAQNSIGVCGNDYTATNVQTVRNLFAPPRTGNPDPRPVFLAINCISNSPSHGYRQLIVKDFYAGGGQEDFTARIATWRNTIDSVQAPPPQLGPGKLTNAAYEFTIPGQRGRTNRVEATTNLDLATRQWVTITNVFGTNANILIRDADAGLYPQRFYRVVR